MSEEVAELIGAVLAAVVTAVLADVWLAPRYKGNQQVAGPWWAPNPYAIAPTGETYSPTM
jgi:hypothetical protein